MNSTNCPPILYKYRSVTAPQWTNTRRLLTLGELYMAARASFNDPFDCRASFSLEGSKAQLRDYAVRVFKKLPRAQRRAAAAQIVRDRRERQGGDDLRKASSMFDAEMDSKVGIFCLTAKPDHILMWSHYADSHTGICVGFDCTQPDSPFRKARPVQYKKEYPVCRPIADDPFSVDTAAVFTKADVWAYEEEWRLVNFEEGASLKHVEPRFFRQVILGARIDPLKADEVIELARKYLPETQLLRAELKNAEYGLNLVPL